MLYIHIRNSICVVVLLYDMYLGIFWSCILYSHLYTYFNVCSSVVGDYFLVCFGILIDIYVSICVIV